MTIYRTDSAPAEDVYYRILVENGSYVVCCVQWFDEYDYDQAKWLHYDSKPVWFATEEEADHARYLLTAVSV